MKVGFINGPRIYQVFFDLGGKSLLCVFDHQSSINTKCAIAENKFVEFQFDDFDDFCNRVGYYEPFSVSYPQGMKREILWAVLSTL